MMRHYNRNGAAIRVTRRLRGHVRHHFVHRGILLIKGRALGFAATAAGATLHSTDTKANGQQQAA